MMLSSYTAPFGRSDYVRIYPDYPTLKDADHNTSHPGDGRGSAMVVLVVILGAVICSLFIIKTLVVYHDHHHHMLSRTSGTSSGVHRRPCVPSVNRHIPKLIHTLTLDRSSIDPRVEASNNLTQSGRTSSTKCDLLYRVSGYTTHKWNLQNVQTLIREFYPALLSKWNSYSSDATRLNAAKYVILHHYGGIFVDHSMRSNRCYNIALQMLNDKTVRQDTLLFSRDNKIDTGIFASKRCSQFMAFSIDLLTEHHRQSLPPFSDFIVKPNRDFLLYSIGRFRSTNT